MSNENYAKMRIKIIRVPCFFTYFDMRLLPSLGMAGIYSFLKERGYDITQEDLNVSDFCRDHRPAHLKNRKLLLGLLSCKKRLADYLAGNSDSGIDHLVSSYLSGSDLNGVDVLLLSVMSEDSCSSVLAMLIARYFKLNSSGKIVIAGGEWYQRAHIYDNFGIYNSLKAIDYHIMGPGELSLDMLLRKIRGDSIDLKDISGLSYCNRGEIIRNEVTAQPVLGQVSFYGLPIERYRWNDSKFFIQRSPQIFSDKSILVLPVKNIVGCPNRCAFCGGGSTQRLLYREPSQAVKNLADLSREYNTKYFFFMDDLINVSKRFITEFCEEIIKSKLDICWSACASFRGLNDPQIYKLMRKAGACRLIFGLEAASPRLLEAMNKDLDLDQVAQGLRWSHEADIWTELETIVGFPHENQEDVLRTLRFLNANRSYIDGVWLNEFFLDMGSPMFRNLGDYGITNIRRDDSLREVLRENEKRHYLFDEVNGLSWKDKSAQAKRAYDRVALQNLANGASTSLVADELSVIFYLYSHLSNIADIKTYMAAYRNKNLRFLIWKSCFFIQSMLIHLVRCLTKRY